MGKNSWQWLKAFLRSVFTPYNCKKCGQPYHKITAQDCTPAQRAGYARYGVLSYILRHAYRCDRCGIVCLID